MLALCAVALPGGQELHDVRAGNGANFPGWQFEHSDADAAEYIPVEHCWHSEAVATFSAKRPATHGNYFLIGEKKDTKYAHGMSGKIRDSQK